MDVTIKDIALDANVSVSTVSRVINDSKSVSDELRRRVMRSVQKYNYKPSAAARSLVTRSSSLIAILEADVRNPVTALHLKQITEVCMRHDKVVISCDYDYDNDKAVTMLDMLLGHHLDGLIFQGVSLTPAIMGKLRQFECPVVLGNQGPENGECEFNVVAVDSYHMAKDVTKFLIDDGHRRIAYVGGNKEDYTNGFLRLRGYQDAMAEAGAGIPDSYVMQENFTTEGGIEGMRKIYENSRQLPTAVFAGSDIIAVGVIRYLKSLGLRVPEDISVFGVDDSVSDISDLPLSTVRMCCQGEIFYDALLGKMAGEKKWIYFPYQLVRRNSTRRI